MRQRLVYDRDYQRYSYGRRGTGLTLSCRRVDRVPLERFHVGWTS